MPLVHRIIAPVNVSDGKLELKGKYECEFVAVNNSTLVNVLRQLAALVEHASDIFSETATLTDQVGRRIRSVKLRLDELEAKTELFDPKLVPVPEGSLDDVSVCEKYATRLVFDTKLFCATSRPRFMGVLFDKAGNHCPTFPPRSPITTIERNYNKLNISNGERRPASFAALRDWKLDDYLDEKIATLDKKKQSAHELSRALASPFPSQLVQVDVTGQGFDRMRKSRRSLVIHTKRIRRSKRRNTICGSMPNKECGIQTSFSSVNSPLEEGAVVKKYGIDSGHWSSCTTSSAQEGANGPRSTASAPSPWDPTASISTSSDFLFDDEDRCLTPQLEHFTDGLVSDSDSVDTDGYFTSFRSDCGFPKSKKSSPGEACEDIKEGEEGVEDEKQQHNESDYDLFGKGSTSTTASSCGTVVLRNKPNPPSRTRTSSTAVADMVSSQKDDTDLEARVKRKSLIECVPSLVVVTPSPTLSGSDSPPPLKDPTFSNECSEEDSDRDSGRITPKAEDFSTTNDSECGTLSDTDSEIRSELRPSSTASSTGSGNSTMTLTSAAAMVVTATASILPQPDVIPDVQIIRTKGAPKLDVSREYFSLDTVLLNSSVEEERRVLAQNGDIMTKQHSPAAETSSNPSPSGSLQRVQSPPGSATSGKIRGARVVLDANGEIIFASETLRRKKRPKVSFDPGSAVKTMDYDNFATTYGRIRESVYDRIVKKDVDGKENEKLYECIEEIRKQNLRHPYLHLQEEKSIAEIHTESMNLKNNNNLEEIGAESNGRCSSTSSNCSSVASSRYASRPPLSPPKDDNDEITKAKNNILLLETDLDSAIPPSMPDLKNLPKIKDRLKRNESYRMANTDEEAAANARRPSPTNSNNANNASSRPALLSLSSPHLRMTMNNKLNRRMSFASSKDNSPHGNLHLNKKRDILEDPGKAAFFLLIN
ncbi:Wiskott-Aldrich syndrome protein family member 2 [Folsomia candida]|uniref:Wiskott-Aldrich syndrome protein family member 2 n=1 Tax=Folsomia candida TaxID=158441 RepID=A0A226E856_FOLCA|nr:Wiskott-Aldrich syndrome protein family member 2 [Folsomia candida]